ncbi:MAG: PKD domain-containing protein [Bacteroidota bacterium]
MRFILIPILLLVHFSVHGQHDCFATIDATNNGCDVSFIGYAGTNGTVLSWDWDFGDGQTANHQFPLHTYATSGTYAVSLTIQTSDSCFTTQYDTLYIQACNVSGCVANFSYQGDSCKLQFQDLSTPSNGQTITQWFWEFGDGSFGLGPSPFHQYLAAGSYDVKLFIFDSNGCKDSSVQTIVTNHCSGNPPTPCFADFTHQGDSCKISFQDISSPSTGQIITHWLWNFGDGTHANIPNPVHQYPAAGTYTVTLNTLDSNGCLDSVVKTVVANHCPPPGPCFADFSHQGDSCTIFFQNQSGPAGLITHWSWDFGDGTQAHHPNPVHQYAAAGTYSVKLKIMDSSGCRDSVVKTVVANHCPPPGPCFADFSHQGDSCKIFFQNLSGPSSGSLITHWSWDFGDGTQAHTPNPVHQYAAAGTYSVKLKIMDSSGCRDSVVKTVVANHCPPPSHCHANFTDVKNKCEVAFRDLSTSSDSIISWKWRFGDGAVSSLRHPIHRYPENGRYQVDLIITTASNCQDTVSQMVRITDCQQSCKADFEYEISKLLVYFQDMTLESVENWEWEFGDGETSSQQNPIHKYAEEGTYKVVLRIKTTDGCISWIRRRIVINDCEKNCKADFAVRMNSNCQMEFSDYSSSSDYISSWRWNFGDGQSSTQQFATHTYDSDGVYAVMLEITTNSGCISRVRHRIRIRDCEGGTNRPLDQTSALKTNLGRKLLSSPVQLYPNPSKGIFHLEASFTRSISVEWEIVDIRGQRLVHSEVGGSIVELRQQIDLSKMAEGVYFFQLRTEEGLMYRQKMMKQ